MSGLAEENGKTQHGADGDERSAVDRAAYWLLVSALVWAAISPGLAKLGGFGEWFLRGDLLLGWLAFGLVFLRARNSSRPIALLVAAIVALGLAELVTGALTGTAVLAQAASFALYAFPLAVIATLLLAPPSGDRARKMVFLVLGFGFLQFVVLAFTVPFSTNPDHNKGTFVGLTLGFHLSGAVAGVGALWLLGRLEAVRSAFWSLPLLLSIFLTETRQVAALLPIALGFSPALDLRRWFIRLLAPVLLVLLIVLAPPIEGVSNTAGSFAIGQVESSISEPGNQRKIEAFLKTSEALGESPASLLFGLGQGNSIGFLAQLGDKQLNEDFGGAVGDQLSLDTSPVIQHLGPRLAYGSFSNEFSSVGGLIGDLGLAGSMAFLLGISSVAWMVIGISGRNRGAVQALGLFYLAMGLIYIWWEQPAFTLSLALAIGSGLLLAREDPVAS